MVSATAVMSSFMHVFARVKSISTAQNVADILLTKATGEIADGQGRKFTPLEESAADEEKNMPCISASIRIGTAAGMTALCS